MQATALGGTSIGEERSDSKDPTGSDMVFFKKEFRHLHGAVFMAFFYAGQACMQNPGDQLTREDMARTLKPPTSEISTGECAGALSH